MAETRPSGHPIVPEEIAISRLEVAEIDIRRRLRFLPRWAERVDWLSLPIKGNVEALMVFVEPGRLSIRRWETAGPKIIARYEEIAANHDEIDYEALRLIQDRFERLVIDKDNRAYLGDAALQHLGLPIERGQKSPVYVAVYSNQIDVLSPTYRNEKHSAGDTCLDGLP